MLSARERRFFARAELKTALIELRLPGASSCSKICELREDALDDWRESEIIESRLVGARM